MPACPVLSIYRRRTRVEGVLRRRGLSPRTVSAVFETLARRGVWQTPTLFAMSEGYGGTLGKPTSAIPAEQYALANAELRALWADNQALFVARPEVLRIIQAQAEMAKVVTSDMAKAGVGILVGCDALIAGFCVHDELRKMVEGGMSPLAALQAATLNPARYLHLDDTTGTVAAGKRADLVLLDANPLEDIGYVRRIRAVVAAGRILDRSALDQLLAPGEGRGATVMTTPPLKRRRSWSRTSRFLWRPPNCARTVPATISSRPI